MSKKKLSKLLALYLPYVVIGLVPVFIAGRKPKRKNHKHSKAA